MHQSTVPSKGDTTPKGGFGQVQIPWVDHSKGSKQIHQQQLQIIVVTTRKSTQLKTPTTPATAHKEGPPQGTKPALTT